MREIGSEFWGNMRQENDTKFLLSGRTALDFIIRDILSHETMESVLLPSYCCHTMIEPFVRNGISVRFYDVYFEQGLQVDIPEPRENEIFYLMRYFGFRQIQGIDEEKIRCKWTLIIEDATHSWLSKRDEQYLCDYSYVSYRKWTGLSGIASAVKYAGDFVVERSDRINQKYCGMRRKASTLKQKYMENQEVDKQEFLDLYKEAEELLKKDYVGYVPDNLAYEEYLNLDIVTLKEKRVNNARYLIDNLKDISGIQLMFDEMTDMDVPLFVPILVRKDRDGLRQHLIKQKVYCPVHWPLSEFHTDIPETAKTIYQEELSLICDQRYSLEDMEHIVSIIKKHMEISYE